MIQALIAESVIPVSTTGKFCADQRPRTSCRWCYARCVGFTSITRSWLRWRALDARAEVMLRCLDEKMVRTGRALTPGKCGPRFLLLLVCVAPVCGQVDEGALLAALGDDDFKVRQEATRQLLLDESLTQEQLDRLYVASETPEQRHRFVARGPASHDPSVDRSEFWGHGRAGLDGVVSSRGPGDRA